MVIPDKLPVTCNFATEFEPMDETDAAVAEGAPKKDNHWCLVEMSKDDVAALEAGKTFHFKEHSMGRGGAIALCTQDKTWSMEFLENSNPMYLGSVTGLPSVKGAEENKENKAEENKENKAEEKKEDKAEEKATGEGPAAAACEPVCTLFAQCRGNIFLKPWTGDAQRVRDLLTPRSGDSLPSRVTSSDLAYKVAASQKELKKILEDGPFIECDGAWQLLPAALERELIDTALCIITSHGMDEADVDGELLLREMQQHYGEEGRTTVPSLKFLENAMRSLAMGAPAPAAKAPAIEKGKDAKDKDSGATQKEKGADEKGKEEKTEGKDSEGSAATPALAPPRPGRLALDADKIRLFHGTQILRQPPAEVRRRYDLPPPMPRAKRLRIGAATGGGGGGRDPPLQIEEFCVAYKAVSGKETSVEELENLLGDRMYVDELEGAVHALDIATLPPEPRERLKRLFELSSHWKPDRILALMRPAVKAVKVELWLPKYTRQVFVEMDKGTEQRMITKKFAGLG
mmetsp:Transcript_155488/g.270455  ORF Transcript_155488/g.270455 Transcript_155488/m.270455 type:complete len:516 (+) Transcript_155488:51-1598(+)